jgi:hypothetical protein
VDATTANLLMWERPARLWRRFIESQASKVGSGRLKSGKPVASYSNPAPRSDRERLKELMTRRWSPFDVGDDD